LQQFNASVKACDKLKKGKPRSTCVKAAERRYKAQELTAAIEKCDELKTSKQRSACVALAHKRY
jgi:hypothetical protein